MDREVLSRFLYRIQCIQLIFQISIANIGKTFFLEIFIEGGQNPKEPKENLLLELGFLTE